VIGSPSDQERHLLYLLGNFNPDLARDCAYRANCCSHCEPMKNLFEPHWITSRSGTLIGYRLQLNSPYYFALSHPLSTFKRLEAYWVGNEDAEFCAKLGMIPAYMVNLNRFTLLKLWGDTAKKLFVPTAEPIPEEGYVYWKLQPGRSGQPAELSSMNFVLKQNAEMISYEGQACDSLEDYFTFCFWSFPERGFSDSTIVINDDREVHLVLKAAKSIYIPERTYISNMDLGKEKDMPVEMVTLWGLKKEQSRYELHRINDVVVTKNVARSLDDEESHGQFYINGIVSQFRKRERKFPTLTTVALYEVSHIELIMSVIGMVVLERFQESLSLSLVGTLDEIKRETEQVLRVLLRKATLDKTIGDSISDQFSTSLEYLNPLVTTDGNDVFFMHPSVFVALLERGLLDRLKKDNQSVINVLKLVDVVASGQNVAQIRTSKESEYLRSKGIFAEIVVSALGPAIKQIVFSRIARSQEFRASFEGEIDDKAVEGTPEIERPVSLHPDQASSSIEIATEKDQDIFENLRKEAKRLRKAQADD